MNRLEHRYQIFETAHGFAAVAWNDAGITALRLPASNSEEAKRALMRRLPDAISADPPEHMAAVIARARLYFEGTRSDFTDVPVDLGEQGTLFDRIYSFVRKLSWGETTTYGAVAKALGQGPEVARDVGQAMARNPVPLIIPCHRVLAAGSRIGGFSAPGGSLAKARMLELEGFAPEPDKPPVKDTRQAGFAF